MTSFSGRALLATTSRPWVQRLFTEHSLGRRLATRFVAGETLDEAIEAARRLNDIGATASMDHLGEHIADVAAAERALADYDMCLDRLERDGLRANISIKLTQLGLAIDPDMVVEPVTKLANRAAAIGTTVTIDMEESRYTEDTIRVFEAVQPQAGNLGIAVQSYLYRTRADMERLVPLGGHIRLCKGAYREPESVAYQSKADVDANFLGLMAELMASDATYPAIATHDVSLIRRAEELARSRSGPWEFQMLYGVQPKLQRRLLAEGYPVRVYIPYGAEWYPYLTRRLAERPANMLFFARALVRR